MSEQNHTDQTQVEQNESELNDEKLENVAGGITDGGCIQVGTPPYFPTTD